MSLLEPTPLLPFFEWMEKLPLSVAISGSVWLYAVDQALHLVMLAVFMGAILAVDLRLLVRPVRQQTISQVARGVEPWLIGGFLGLLLTGVPQMMSTATKEFYSPYFWFKMYALVVALVYTFTIRRKVALMDDARRGPILSKATATVSLLLWLSVVIPARLIGLL